MYKKITQAIAVVLATGMILSGPASAAPYGEMRSMVNGKAKENLNQNQVEEKGQKQNKGQLQQLMSVDKQLDKIEEKINHYRTKLTDIEEPDDEIEKEAEEALGDEKGEEESNVDTADDSATEVQTSDGTVEESITEDGVINSLDGSTQTKGQVPSGETIEGNSESVNGVDSEKPTEIEAVKPVNEETTEETPNSDLPADVSEEANETELEQPADELEGAGQTVEVNEESEEFEDEAEKIDEELQNNQGYLGKFRALQNRLNEVTNKLDALSSNGVDSALITERYNRIEALRNGIFEVTSSIQRIEKKIKEKIETDDTVLEETPVDDVPLTKEWYITFSNILNEATLSDLDIVVLNQEQGLVETTISYSATEKTIVLTPLQPYKAGETYTLYIGNEISDENGLDLKNSIKMEFTVK